MGFQRRHMEVLVAIADTGSIHKAAGRLGVAQPAVSRLISEVERSVGAKLFERAASGSSLTRRGDALVAHARVLLRGLERLDRVAAEQPGSVRLGCIPRAMHTLMPFVVNLMQDAVAGDPPVPACQLQVVEDSSTALLEGLQRGSLDLAVMRHVGGAAGIGPGLQVERLYDERPLVIARVKHPMASRRQLTLAALLNQRWVLTSAQTPSRAVLDSYCQAQGLAAIQPALETRSFESCAALVAGTDLLSLIPESIARQHERAGLIAVLPVSPTLPGTAVLLVGDPAAADDPLLSAFRRLVGAAAARAREKLSLRA